MTVLGRGFGWLVGPTYTWDDPFGGAQTDRITFHAINGVVDDLISVGSKRDSVRIHVFKDGRFSTCPEAHNPSWSPRIMARAFQK